MRSNSLEIHGVPEDKTKDVYEVVKNVGSALNMNISREDIDVCHRLGRRSNSNTPAGISVKFVRREKKQEMLGKRRVKRDLTNQHLEIHQNMAPIYINESLGPVKRKLFAAARMLKKDKQYTYLWIRNGKIFIRKNQGDSALPINSMDDIEKLK
ncbi:uncharacterized protein LOC142330652 [Lycorma delicatula]|uniref:uncharacterized protein LOC142330652 n=1 Tax=Lycorma delicatula TaxID=130591 RepID=UPI003F518954